ncbi:MAG: hypothetical protein AAGH17_00030 [Pseudomonadota bacterium]
MAQLALLAWPVLTLIVAQRLSFHKTILVSLIGGFLLLPTKTGWDFPLLPAFDKDSIPGFTLLVLALLLPRAGGASEATAQLELPGWLPRTGLAILGLVLMIVGNQMTALTNGESLSFGPTNIPGLRIYDGFSLILGALTMLVPFFLGRKFFAHPETHVLLLKGLIIAAVGYSFLALYEARMSPQLNIMLYGFFPHSFPQHVRAGGYRPIVFTEHGLQLALFFAASTLAAFGVWRSVESKRRRIFLLAAFWLLGTLVLMNSLGALIIAVVFLPVVLFLGRPVQLLCAAIVCSMILLYPMLRGADLFPTDRLVSMAAAINPGRAPSLAFRFRNEAVLLERAGDKPLFGWGGWNRNRVFDPETGQDTTVTDGAWVVLIGTRGWIGYLAIFGLLAAPGILLAANRRRYDVSPITVTLALVLTASLVDLIPNGFLSPVTILLAGALWGRLELGGSVQNASQAAVAQTPHGRQAYTRAAPSPPLSTGTPKSSAYTRQVTRHQRIRKTK